MSKCSHFEGLLCAIERIDPQICTVKENETDSSKRKFINERSFAYELYRTWNNLRPRDLIINAEVTKKIEREEKEDNKFLKIAQEIFGKEVLWFQPDMVLHSGQEDSDQQEIICEIKVKTSLTKDNLKRDLKKLFAYTTNGCVLYHPFKQGVFILLGGHPEDIKGMLTQEDMNQLVEYKNKIEKDCIRKGEEPPIVFLFVQVGKNGLKICQRTYGEIKKDVENSLN